MSAPAAPTQHATSRKLFNVYEATPNLISINSTTSGANGGFNSYLGGVYYLYFPEVTPGHFALNLRNYDSNTQADVSPDAGTPNMNFKRGKFLKATVMSDNFAAPNTFSRGMVISVDVTNPSVLGLVYYENNAIVAFPATSAFNIEVMVSQITQGNGQ